MKSIYKSEVLKALEGKIDMKFNNKLLLQRAITHKSFSNENEELNLKNNERLEFLGDSVLSIVISTYLFEKFPNYPEGELARMRAVIVSEPLLAVKAREINIGSFLLLGHGEGLTGGRNRDSILADTLEALFAAIYIEKGFDQVQMFILNHFQKIIIDVENGKHLHDYKTILQENIQKNDAQSPRYKVINELGPDHNKVFKVHVIHRGKTLGKGKGKSKKEAEQNAARSALEKMNQL